MHPTSNLAVAATVWFLLHAGVAGSGLRQVLIRRLSEKGYSALFSVFSVASLLYLVQAYNGAPCMPLWSVPWLFGLLPTLVMPFALTLLGGAFTVPNPTAVGGEAVLERQAEARGVQRITRHPFLWAVAAWSTAHLLVSGTWSGLLFFGSLALTALQGTRDIDAKRRRAKPAEFAKYQAVTSNLPFAALLSGRNHLVWGELKLPLLIGIALFVLMLAVHGRLFQASPMPWLTG